MEASRVPTSWAPVSALDRKAVILKTHVLDVLMIRRLLLSFGGEALQSGFHFLLSLLLIRFMGAHDFGLFAIIFIVGGVSLSYANALISVPASVEIARTKRAHSLTSQEVDFGTLALLFSVVIGGIVAGGLWLTLKGFWESAAGGAFVGSWTLRNHVRTILFARDEASSATVSDCFYSVAGVAIVAAVLLCSSTNSIDVIELMFGLTTANAVSLFAAFWAAGRWPRVRFQRKLFDVFKSIRKETGWSLLTATTGTLQSQALTFLIAATAGPAAYAPVAAGALLFAPLRPAVWAIVQVYRPNFARAFSDGSETYIKRTGFVLTAAIAICSITLFGLIWAGWTYIDAYIFHRKFDVRQMQIIVALVGTASFLYLTYNVPLTILQAAGRFKPIATATIIGACTSLLSVGLFLRLTSMEWSFGGVVLGEVMCGLCLWLSMGRMLRLQHARRFEAAGTTGARPMIVS